MRQILNRWKTLASIALTLVGVFAVPRNVQAQSVTYTGEAVVVSASALGIANVAIEDTGPLPSSGGSLSTQLASANVPGLVNAQLLTASTAGQNSQTNSQATVSNVSVTVAGISIQTTILTSHATAACYPDHATVSGSSTIASLTVNGQSITVTGAPNQTVPLLVGSLVINEQISSVSNSPAGTSADMLVNALHLSVTGIANVVISSAHAGVTCGNPAPPKCSPGPLF
jgi:hypothetical protein